MTKKARKTAEFGDFQTPPDLANEVCALLRQNHDARRRGGRSLPASIVEPTCGRGTFLVAALRAFPSAQRALALDINPHHVAALRHALNALPAPPTDVLCQDFFRTDWPALLQALPEPLLLVGNPPWVTNADLGALRSDNLPTKSNFQGHVGMDAITGKSNFDISEWMLIHLLEWLGSRNAVLAMLCKTAVARKVLTHAWKAEQPLTDAALYPIDALKTFGAAVDACLLVVHTGTGRRTTECAIYESLSGSRKRSFGQHEGTLVADVQLYRRWSHLRASRPLKWRSGIKHDCARVMELSSGSCGLVNGLSEPVAIETDHLYPMFKSSELANGRTAAPHRMMLVTQRRVGEDTTTIRESAPRTWQYLMTHALDLDRRASTIYKGRPRFAVFAVGDYTFAPWKVAISGFYKRLSFAVVGPHQGKPVVFDDTVYFLAFETQQEAEYVAALLSSTPAQEFFGAFVFWDSKRPITSELLGRLNLLAVAAELGQERKAARLLGSTIAGEVVDRQQTLFA